MKYTRFTKKTLPGCGFDDKKCLFGNHFEAGGPHYLFRFACKRTLTVNTSAVGGNASLLTLSD